MFDLSEVQSALREFQLDGWLLYDFRGLNVLAQRVLAVPDEGVGSRRFLYCIPAQGEPKKLVHRLEQGTLDHLPGSKTVYLKWQELEKGIADLLAGMKKVAMEYSPGVSNPYISRVDAGTIEFVRSLGVEVVSSGDLVQMFEATWDDRQWDLHLKAAAQTNAAFGRAWQFIADEVRTNGSLEETAVRDLIMSHFAEQGMTTHHPPVVAVGPNSRDGHYETGSGENTTIRSGDFVLIDQWAKIDHPHGVYSDLTRVGYVGETVPEEYNRIFQIVAAARDAAIQRVREAFAANRPLEGWEVDQASRDVIEEAGYGEYFAHRTGHSIGRETHGNGANMDNLETHDQRRVLKRTGFSIEPGIYLPEFGIRSEVNVFVDGQGEVHVTGGEIQQEVLAILAEY